LGQQIGEVTPPVFGDKWVREFARFSLTSSPVSARYETERRKHPGASHRERVRCAVLVAQHLVGRGVVGDALVLRVQPRNERVRPRAESVRWRERESTSVRLYIIVPSWGAE